MSDLVKEFQLVEGLFLRGENHTYVLAREVQGFELREAPGSFPTGLLIVAVTSNGNSYPMSYPHRANHLDQLQMKLGEAVRLLARVRQPEYAVPSPVPSPMLSAVPSSFASFSSASD